MAAAIALAGAQWPGTATAASCTWNTAAGNWNALVNWVGCATGNGNPAGVPGTADTAGIGGTGVVAVTSNQGINTLNNAGTVNVATSSSLLLNAGGGGTTNSGTINIADGAAVTFDGRAGAHNIGGGGSFVLGGPGSRIFMEGGGTTTLATGTTIRGAGQIGQAIQLSAVMSFVNNGLISADVSGQSLTLVTPANVGSYTNNGRFEARNGGTLQLSANVGQGAAGVIKAENGSTVLISGATVNGGTLDSAGTGAIRASNTNANLFNNVTLNGVVDLTGAASQLRLGNNAVINGRIDVGAAGNLYIDNRSVAGLSATQSLSGLGTINLAGGALRVEGTGQTTLGSNLTVAGFGTFGQAILESGTHTLINDGLISANTNGQTLTLQRIANGGAAVQNNGILEATNGGTLRVQADVVGSTGSQLRATAGSTILLDGVTVAGTVNTGGGGVLTTTNSNANLFNNVTLNGVVDLTGAASQLRLGNNAVINGRIDVGAAGNLYIDNRSAAGLSATQSITGNGSIVLSGGALRMEGSGVSPTTTTIGPNVVVRGFGTAGQAILESTAMTLVNNGTFSADVNGQTLALQRPGNIGVWSNQALMEARNGGTLRLDGGVTQGAGGIIRAENGSTVLMNGATVVGGVLDSVGTGAIRANNSNANLFVNVTLNGVVDLTGAASQLRLGNNAVINGRIDVGGASNLYIDNRASNGLSATQSLSGLGTINLAGGALRVEGTGQTTLGSNLTVAGFGTFGQAILESGAHTLVNNGTINANVAGQTLTLQSMANNGGITGTGTLRVDGGTLSVATGRATSQGVLDIGAAGTLATNNQSITLSSDYTNAQAGTGNTFNRRAGVTGTGQILAGGDVAQVITGANVTGGNTNNATLTIGNVRVGSTTFDYQVANAGTTGPTLRGALQTAANGGTITDTRLTGSGVTAGNYSAGAPGGNSGNLAVTFNAATAGALAPLTGQVVNLRSNFDNIADQKLNIVVGAGAAAYNVAVGSVSPSPTVTVGNQRVLGNTQADLTVSNIGPAGAFTEKLNASFTGSSGDATNNLGSVSLLSAGASDSTSMKVGLNTSSAGAKSGTITVGFQSDGTGTSGLGTIGAGSQTVNVQGNVYQVALGQIQSAPLNFGTVQVGQSVSQNLVVRNVATGPSGFVEDLNVAFGAITGTGAAQVGGVGSLTGILAGQNSNAGNGTMTVLVNTGTAGTINANVAVTYLTSGKVAGVSNGLAVVGTGQEQYGVTGTIITGNVINQASPQINNPTINLGNVRIGSTSPTANVSVTNVATATPQAALNASITGNGPITGSGSFNLLAPGATNNTTLQVGMNTGTAGAISGIATVAFVSDAGNVGNCAPNCQLTLASQAVNVTGNVYRLANAQDTTSSVTLASRVGGTAAGTISITNQSADQFTEALKVTAGAAPAGFNVAGSPVTIAAQNTGNLQVNLNTGTAGIFGGNLTLTNVSTGAGTTGAADLTTGTSNVALQGKVYTAAQGTVLDTVDFGIVHVGDAIAARGVSVQNSAAATALNDTLQAGIGGATGPFTSNNGSVAGLVAGGAADNTSLTVGLNTAAAGVFNGSATVGLTSHNADMADLGLSAQTLALIATVNNYANADFAFGSGAGSFLETSNNVFTLDFGNITLGSGVVLASLNVLNNVFGPADLLDGGFTLTDAGDFNFGSLFGGSFQNLAAGGSLGGYQVSFSNTGTLGSFVDEIVLNGTGHNASGYSGAVADVHLIVRANVVQAGGGGGDGGSVPEPATLVLMSLALLGLVAQQRRRHAATQALH